MADISNSTKGIITWNILSAGTVHFVLARPPLENGEHLEKSGQANLEASEKASGKQENLATNTLDQDKALSAKDQEVDAKRQRLKNEEASMDTMENNLETKDAPIRADVDLAEDKPTTAQTMACNPGLLDSSQEFTRSPHPILKAQTEPEFEGELLFLYLAIHVSNKAQ